MTVACMNTQGAGEVTLRSSNPADAPLIDSKFLAHPYDRRVAIEAVREGMRFLEEGSLKGGQVRLAEGPRGEGEEDVLVS